MTNLVVGTTVVVRVHQFLLLPIVLYFGVLALLGAFWFFRSTGGPGGNYLGALIIGEGLIVVQAIVGLLVFASGKHPHQGLHWLYGAILLLALPIAYGLGSQREEQDRLVTGYYAIACALIVVVAIVRAAPTGGS
jgi:heme A synthase